MTFLLYFPYVYDPFGDAAELVRTIFPAVKYIHDCDIVHRNLKPEKLLFRSTPEKTSEIMIADFGLNQIVPNSMFNILTEVCGTPGARSPFLCFEDVLTHRFMVHSSQGFSEEYARLLSTESSVI
jgi:serine/threonine protein kinase